MKKLCIVIVIAACLVFCAAVWPQTAPAEEVSVTPLLLAVTATQPETPEEEKAEVTQPEPLPEVIPYPELMPEEVPEALEVELIPEPAPTPSPSPSQTATEPQPSGTVYVPGFGWLESQGTGAVTHDESIYENGNKVGSMG